MTLASTQPHWFKLMIVVVLVGLSPRVNGEDDVVDSLFYYEIGGGKSFSGPPSYNVTSLIDGSASIQLHYSCGKFDIEENLKRYFDDLEDGFDSAVNAILYAAQNQLLNNIVLYILRRADPNLADMLENAMLRYEAYLQVAIKDCKLAEEQILNGENPFYDYIKIGKSQVWREEAEKAEAGDTTATLTNTQRLANETTACITWINEEERLCETQEAIELVNEIAVAGYASLADNAGTGQFGISDSRLTTVWPTPEAAALWINDAFGEIKITDVYLETPATQSGVGVLPSVFQDALAITQAINNSVASPSVALSPDQQNVLSVPGLKMTPVLLQVIQEIDNQEFKQAAIEKMATEFSILKNLEKLSLARRVLSAGLFDPNVMTAAFPAKFVNTFILPSIQAEYEMLQDEYELRQKVASSSAQKLIEQYGKAASDNTGLPGSGNQHKPMSDGAFKEDP